MKLTPAKLLCILALAVFAVETLVMLALSLLPPSPGWIANILDAALLVTLIFPVLYFLVFQPLRALIARRVLAEQGLLKHREHLEELVASRTAELMETTERLREAEREQAEQKTRESEEKFARLVGSMQDAAIMVDGNGMIELWNPAAEKIFGYTVAEAAGKPMHELITPERFRGEEKAGFEKFRETGQGPVIGKVLELPGLRKDGTEFLAEHSISAVKIGGEWHAIGVVRDITERKHAEEALRNSEARLQLQIQRMPIGLIQWGPEFRVQTWNPAAERIFGFTADEALGKHPYDFIVPEMAQPQVDAIWRRLLEGDTTAHSTNENLTKDGRRILCEWNNTPLKQPDGTVVGVLSMVQDVTEHTQHDERIKKLNALLLTIRVINEQMLITKDEHDLFQKICNILLNMEGISFAWVGLKERDFAVKPVAWAGIEGSVLTSLVIRWDDSEHGRGAVGTAIRTNQAVVITDVEQDPRLAPWKQTVLTKNIQFVIALPLVHDADVIGALAVYSEIKDAFGEEEITFLTEVAGDIAIGVKSLRLAARLEATLQSLRKSLNGTVEAIATMGELRDPYTAGHERGVARLACAIAQDMGLPEKQMEGIHIMAYLHDIGKIAVPAEILSKPTKLSENEFGIVKSHAQVGYEILKDLEFPWPVADAVRQHHERLDGSGYPQGLKGDEIMLEAKILAVSDVVEAMASHRPYRPALGIDKALLEILTKKGKLYDPAAVDACMKLFTERGFKLE